jgi:hypothetical protein
MLRHNRRVIQPIMDPILLGPKPIRRDLPERILLLIEVVVFFDEPWRLLRVIVIRRQPKLVTDRRQPGAH